MIVNKYGDITARSYAAEGTITLIHGENIIDITPDQMRTILADHSPEGFYDDLPEEPEQASTKADLEVSAIIAQIAIDPNYILTPSEAEFIWDEYNKIAKRDFHSGRVLSLAERLERELVTGKRCAVCGRYESPDCAENC